MKLYTKTGDQGTTGLFSGKRVSKTSKYVEAYGSVDELNSFVGFTKEAAKSDDEIFSVLLKIQHELHKMGSDLATPTESSAKIDRLSQKSVDQLEQWIDLFESELPELKQFILPGGSELSARFHLCRTVARRAERRIVELSQEESINEVAVVYMNRLSDLFFCLSRLANKRAGVADSFWDKTQ